MYWPPLPHSRLSPPVSWSPWHEPYPADPTRCFKAPPVPVAQLVEQSNLSQLVEGSNPSRNSRPSFSRRIHSCVPSRSLSPSRRSCCSVARCKLSARRVRARCCQVRLASPYHRGHRKPHRARLRPVLRESGSCRCCRTDRDCSAGDGARRASEIVRVRGCERRRPPTQRQRSFYFW